MKKETRKDLGLLALRLGTGGLLAAHGSQKLFGWFGGGGLEGTGEAMHQMGFRPGKQNAMAAAAGEAGGGSLLALGLGTPAAGAAAAGAMAAAVSVHSPAGFFNTSGGYEFPAFLGFAAAGLGLTGPGRYSLDHVLGHRLNRPWTVGVSFAVTALAAAVVVGRRKSVQASDEPEPAASAD